jgi:4'-phosphopantetheinyl transferase
MSVTVLITSEFVPTPWLAAEWLLCLPRSRRAEMSRWPDERERQRSLLGTRLLAMGLRWLGYSDSVLASLQHPSLSKPTVDVPVDFSLSHADGLIACALSTEGPVGIDVEKVASFKADDFKLYLDDSERAWAGRSALRFLEVWTRKEAVAKAADSRGLRDVPRIHVDAAAQCARFEGRAWQTRRVPVGRAHVASLALGHEPLALNVQRVARRTLERRASAHDPWESGCLPCAGL